MRNKVAVVGSYNIDQSILVPHLPMPGETIIGHNFSSGPGGKGANQAVAAARAGAEVTFIARVGCDAITREAISALQSEGLNTDYLITDPAECTGRALIVVDEHGENSIVVAPGANAHLCPADIALARSAIASANVLLLQLETPLETVRAAAQIASESDTMVILNPAPAGILGAEILSHIDILTPNIVEAAMLTGIEATDASAYSQIACALRKKGVHEVIITLGNAGTHVTYGEHCLNIPAYSVDAVDSTAAGDVFNGCLAAFMTEHRGIREAVEMASAAAALSVTRIGAQASIPFIGEIEGFYKQRSVHP